MSDEPTERDVEALTEVECEAMAEAIYERKVAWSRTAMTPWRSLQDFQREQQRIPALEQAVERIISERIAQQARREGTAVPDYHPNEICACSTPGWTHHTGFHLFVNDRVSRALREARAVLTEYGAKSAAMSPNDYKTGQDHLPPAFRVVNFQAAFMALVDLWNGFETDLRAALRGDA